MRRILLLFAVLLPCLAPWTAFAQTATPCMLPPTVDVPGDVAARARNYLAAKGTDLCWAITYYDGTHVSMAGMPSATPDWTLSNAVAIDSITIPDDKSSSPTSLMTHSAPRIMADAPSEAPIMPFKGTAIYGTNGVHDAGYFGMLAVDFVGVPGDMENMVYASVGGTITYVCKDNINYGFLVDSDGFDFLYLHLDPVAHAPLPVGTVVSQGQALGPLVLGSFQDRCGFADQQGSHYHLHFGFYNGVTLAIDGYTLDFVTEQWTDTVDGGTISPGQSITSRWMTNNPPPEPWPTTGESPWDRANFWDNILSWVQSRAEAARNILPQHNPMGLSQRVVSLLRPALRYFTVLIPFRMTVPLWVFGIIAFLETVRFTYSAWMWLKRAIPLFG